MNSTILDVTILESGLFEGSISQILFYRQVLENGTFKPVAVEHKIGYLKFILDERNTRKLERLITFEEKETKTLKVGEPLTIYTKEKLKLQGFRNLEKKEQNDNFLKGKKIKILLENCYPLGDLYDLTLKKVFLEDIK